MLAKEVVGPYRQCGTLQDWTATVGALAAGHRLLRFSIATALAGTLLDIGGFESGCFHFFGKSSEGKTTCLRVAASVWGSGADGGYVRTWRATANGLEAALAGASDTCLPLDEVGQVDGRELGQALYMATGGVGKQRMRRDATLKALPRWRVLVLSSGELPIETKLNEDAKHGARAHAGQLVRAVDIPSASDARGVSTRLELGEVSPSAFADQCKSAASAHYGTAGPEFVRQLIAHNISEKDVRERVDTFVRTRFRTSRVITGKRREWPERFGLDFCGGRATACNLEFFLGSRATRSTTRWSSSRYGLKGAAVGAPYEARQAVAQVRHFIEAHGDSRFEKLVSLKDEDRRTCADLRDPDARSPLNRAGCRKGEGAEERWLIFPEVWTKEVCAGLDPSQVAATLSRDFWHGQRIGDALAVEIDDGVMDGLVEGVDVCECLVGEVMGVKIAPDRLDFIEFGGVVRRPLDGEPVCAGGQGGERAFAGGIGPLSSTSTTGLACRPGCGPKRRASCSRRAMKSLLRLVGLA